MEWVDCGVWEVGVLGTVALRAGEWRSELAALWLCDMWFLGGGVLQVKALSKSVELKQVKGCDRGTQWVWFHQEHLRGVSLMMGLSQDHLLQKPSAV